MKLAFKKRQGNSCWINSWKVINSLLLMGTISPKSLSVTRVPCLFCSSDGVFFPGPACGINSLPAVFPEPQFSSYSFPVQGQYWVNLSNLRSWSSAICISSPSPFPVQSQFNFWATCLTRAAQPPILERGELLEISGHPTPLFLHIPFCLKCQHPSLLHFILWLRTISKSTKKWNTSSK